MVALNKKQCASEAHSYYVNELKHEISQHYYRHYERILQAEEHTLALEIYHSSYSYRDIEYMKKSDIPMFAAKTIAYCTEGSASCVRLNLADPVLLPISHRSAVLSHNDELNIHYLNLLSKVREQAQSEELESLMSRIDAMADRMSILSLIVNLKKMGGFVSTALREMQSRIDVGAITTKG